MVMKKQSEIQKKIKKFINGYLHMNILGHDTNCPYWSNKLKDGLVVVRGFLNGKADSQSIRIELEKLLFKHPKREEILSDPAKFRKFAKNHRIGIDCSGLVFRILDNIVSLSEIFMGGINKTNANTLTSQDYCRRIESAAEAQPADMIRINAGRHVVLIVDVTVEIITYIHSSSRLTEAQGVHLGEIRLTDKSKELEYQDFQENTKEGGNFGKKYFHKELGDGIFRLKVFPALS